MRHLSPEELLDLADGTTAEASADHLARCAACRAQLSDLRETMGLALSAGIPEPSPLFWDHLSARVRESIAADVPARRSVAAFFGFERLSWRVMIVAGGAAVVFIVAALVLTMRTAPGSPEQAAIEPPAASSAPVVQERDPVADDASLALLTELAGDLDWESAADAGMMLTVGAADEAVHELSGAERAELRRLLREAMGGAGA
jgi:hypothetical protein